MDSLIEGLKKLIAGLQSYIKTMPPEPVESTVAPLLTVAMNFIGIDASPRDLAPDSFGCAETLSNIIKKLYPIFPVVTGTWSLWDAIRVRPRFLPVSTLIGGDIILCVTGQGRGTIPNGHAGIYMGNGKIASNDSITGKFVENFTLETWNKRFVEQGKYPQYYYRLVP